MEATQINVSNGFEDGAVSVGFGGQLIGVSEAVRTATNPSIGFCTDVMVASFENKKLSNTGDQHLQVSSISSMHMGTIFDPMVQVPTSSPGVSNCYVYKSRLQEYAQRVGLPTPVYETIKEGLSHEPSFRSSVVVGGERYESLPGFFNRKAAEQSAAEVALMQLSRSGDKKDSIAVPVHETGLCKNLLQEYAQKMNYAIPKYICRKDDTPGRTPLFSCTVEIGGIQYIGASARTKKEAEIKAARTALLAIRSSGTVGGQTPDGKPQYTVFPGKRKIPETDPKVESVKVKKPKKPRYKKKLLNKKKPCDLPGIMGVPVSNGIGTATAIQQFKNGSSDVHVPNHGQNPDCLASSEQDLGLLKNNQLNGESSVIEDASGPRVVTVETQVSASGCQPHASKKDDVDDAIPMPNASLSMQSDVLLPDSCTVQENSATVPDTTHEHDNGNNDDAITMPNAPLSVQSDVLLPDSCIVQENSAAVPDINHEHDNGNNDPGVSKVIPMINAPLSEQLDALPTDSGISQEDAAAAVEGRSHVEGENHARTNIVTD